MMLNKILFGTSINWLMLAIPVGALMGWAYHEAVIHGLLTDTTTGLFVAIASLVGYTIGAAIFLSLMYWRWKWEEAQDV